MGCDAYFDFRAGRLVVADIRLYHLKKKLGIPKGVVWWPVRSPQWGPGSTSLWKSKSKSRTASRRTKRASSAKMQTRSSSSRRSLIRNEWVGNPPVQDAVSNSQLTTGLTQLKSSTGFVSLRTLHTFCQNDASPSYHSLRGASPDGRLKFQSPCSGRGYWRRPGGWTDDRGRGAENLACDERDSSVAALPQNDILGCAIQCFQCLSDPMGATCDVRGAGRRCLIDAETRTGFFELLALTLKKG